MRTTTYTHPFGRWLRTSAWTARELADILGVSRQVIYYWAAGRCAPRAENLAKMETLTKGHVTLAMWQKNAA